MVSKAIQAVPISASLAQTLEDSVQHIIMEPYMYHTYPYHIY